MQPNTTEIRRHSSESSVTIPYERSFRRIGAQAQPKNAQDLSQFQFCGCGWPQHMLLPKGTPEGTEYNLFVLISDFEQDRIASATDWYVFTCIRLNYMNFHIKCSTRWKLIFCFLFCLCTQFSKQECSM